MSEFPYKLGKKPAQPIPPEAKKFSFSSFSPKRGWPVIPQRFGGYNRVPDWQMLANDKYGCCVWSGAAHEHKTWTRVGDAIDAIFDDKSVLSDYRDATGFDPNDPDTDQGTDMRAAADYRRRTGIVDANGVRHKILASLNLKPGSVEHLRAATYLYGAVGVGLYVTDKAMQQFDDRIPWSIVSKANEEGGHYVPCLGWNSMGHPLVVTWGRLHAITPAYYEKYSDEAMVYLTDEFMVDGRTPQGYQIPELRRFLQGLR